MFRVVRVLLQCRHAASLLGYSRCGAVGPSRAPGTLEDLRVLRVQTPWELPLEYLRRVDAGTAGVPTRLCCKRMRFGNSLWSVCVVPARALAPPELSEFWNKPQGGSQVWVGGK
eukprot:4037724-Alexandrium_andersonii.AAC.1